MAKSGDFKKVEVRWNDAASTSDNLALRDAQKVTPVTREQVGYLIAETDNEIKLSFGFFDDDNWDIRESDYTLIILKGMIVSIKELA